MSEVLDQATEILEDTQKDKFLAFLVGKEEYAIEIKYVTEVNQ